MSEVNKKKVESEIKDIAGTTCTPLKQIYDSHVTLESNIQPFVKLQWANAGKEIYHPHQPLLRVSKIH